MNSWITWVAEPMESGSRLQGRGAKRLPHLPPSRWSGGASEHKCVAVWIWFILRSLCNMFVERMSPLRHKFAGGFNNICLPVAFDKKRTVVFEMWFFEDFRWHDFGRSGIHRRLTWNHVYIFWNIRRPSWRDEGAGRFRSNHRCDVQPLLKTVS